jgi:hypothetical protein
MRLRWSSGMYRFCRDVVCEKSRDAFRKRGGRKVRRRTEKSSLWLQGSHGHVTRSWSLKRSIEFLNPWSPERAYEIDNMRKAHIVFWNWCPNVTCRSWISDSTMYRFINAMTNILLNNLKLTIQNPSNLITSKILTFLGKIYWNGFEIWHSWCDNFFEIFLMHKSMTSFWQGQFWIKVPANLAWSKLHILLSSQF